MTPVTDGETPAGCDDWCAIARTVMLTTSNVASVITRPDERLCGIRIAVASKQGPRILPNINTPNGGKREARRPVLAIGLL